MDGQNSTKFCIYITIDMIYPLSVLQTELNMSLSTYSFMLGLWSDPLTILVFAGNKNNHKVLHEFKIWPDQTMVCGVSCSWTSEKIFYLHVPENYPKYFYDMLARRWAIIALWATCLSSFFLTKIQCDFWQKKKEIEISTDNNSCLKVWELSPTPKFVVSKVTYLRSPTLKFPSADSTVSKQLYTHEHLSTKGHILK